MAFESLKSCCLKSGSKWSHLTRGFPVLKHKLPVASKWICLVVGCIGMACGNSVWQNSWQNAMRAIFNQTETDANLVSTLGGIGATISLPAGFTYEIFGTQMNALIGGLVAGLSYLLLALATGPARLFFAENDWLVVTLYFVIGFGCSFMYMASLIPNTQNFSYNKRGMVIGILDASASVGPVTLSILYNSAFTNGYIDPGQEGKQNLSGYFVVVAVLTLFINTIVFFFVGRLHQKHDDESSVQAGTNDTELDPDDESHPLVDGPNKTVTERSRKVIRPSDFTEFPFEDLPISKVIFRWNFYFLMVQFVLSGCLQITYSANIPTYLRSFYMNEYNMLFTSLGPAVQATAKFGAGVISDVIAHYGRMPRAVVFIIPYTLQTIFLLLSAFYGDNFILLLSTCIIVNIATGFTWCQTPTMLGELFGGKYLGSNWGLALIFSAAFGFPFSIGFSSIYEAEIGEPGEIYCYGLHCFTWSFILMAGASFAALIMAIGLTQNMFRNATERRLYPGLEDK